MSDTAQFYSKPVEPVTESPRELETASGQEAEGKASLTDIRDIQTLKKKYGELYQIDITVGEDDENEGNTFRYYFRKPSTASFNRYLKTVGKNMATSTAAFTNDNIIDEQRDDFGQKAIQYPGLPLNCGNKLLSALGMGDNVNFRKV
nr:MAG TPA: hypothetical protein [Myoviridae sp. ctEXz2]